ncbi:Lysophospholipase L1 [Parafrankia irregularis]|uniref:Lysophospholipase L1 n=1 Tax=Parafrankia irregularis TaxID=795642 RepID=A0A0S4QG90_9ACTN|nr:MULTISPECIES: SGNH/GDSL hydrolase family protein [Parafrankia]EFC80908.1 lipolytic protein G-D-S-L family [Parafrankia sp. EUN1f]MBE3201055.1 SGNH/GDSL hydrolase family protein [Parafrankia sp. CH37]CUU54544.1 Lysophospholipase L1 [Parafrankia irregularis]
MTRARLTVLGDSFAEGRGDPRPDGSYGGWVPLFADLFAVPRGGHRNLGTHQATTSDILHRQVPAALVNKATMIGFIGGVNDLVSDYDPDRFARNLEAILRRLAGPDTVLFTATYPDIPGNLDIPAPFRALLRDRFARANEDLTRAATAVGAVCLDIAAAAEWRGPALWDPDGLHPNPRGHRHFADTMADFVGLHTGMAPVGREPVGAGAGAGLLSY